MDLCVSVIIPVYNAARFIEHAVASALQFNEVKEVILVDDAGPDDSLAVCEKLASREPRVRLLRHPGEVNKGAAGSRNLGMLKAKEDFIAFLDADDIFLPNRFDAEQSVFEKHPDADGVYGAIAPYFHDADSKKLFESTYKNTFTTVHRRVAPEELFQGLIGASEANFGSFHLNTLTLRRSVLKRMDGLMRDDLKLHQDTEFMIRLAWYARLYPGFLDTPVAMRGVHPNNRFTRQRSKHSRYLMYKELWEWASSCDVDERSTEHFHFQYRLLSVVTAPSKVAALRIGVKYRKYLRRYYFRDALFTRSAGEGSRLAKLLHKLTWQYYMGRRKGRSLS